MKKALVSWSSGKDSAWVLHVLRDHNVEVVGLLTTLNQAFERVAMHAVRRTLLEAQAKSLKDTAVDCPSALALLKPAVRRNYG